MTRPIKHFSHRHPLSPFEVDDDDDDDVTLCSGCELELGPGSRAYKCDKPGCEFSLHEACSELPSEIRHASHPGQGHALGLIFEPPGSFSCAGSGTTAFAYVCLRALCGFGLHVRCSALPEALLVEDDDRRHRHRLGLVFSASEEEREIRHCGACGGGFVEGCWAYFCGDDPCGFGAHLDCVISEEEEEEEEEEEQCSLVNIRESHEAVAV